MKFFKQKAYTSSVSLSNHSNKPLTLHIEPWGSQLTMPHGSTFQIVAGAQVQGEIEVHYQENDILVWSWEGSILTVFVDGTEIFW